MGASEKSVSKSTRSVRDRHSVREPGDGDLSAPTAGSEAVAFEKTALPPATGTASGKPKTERRLLRKSSSASLLDVEGTADDPGAHKLRRKSSSLRDLTAEEAATLKEKHDPRKASRKSKRSDTHTTALPPLTPKTGRDHTSQVHSEYQPRDRPKRRKRAGDIELQRQPTIHVVVKYQLGQTELKKFKLCFNQIDLDQSGSIDYDEFFEFIDERKTPFSEGLFRLIDADSNGTIDFEEFVHATVMYCMYTRDEILQFAFDTFDPGKTGGIGEKEFKRLISLVNDGKPAFPGNFKSALAEFDRNKDGVIDFDEFKILNKRYPMLLFPCFRLQDRMQKSTLGENHWHKLHKRLYERLKLENYQRKHNGALPPLGVVGTIRKFLGLNGRDLYVA